MSEPVEGRELGFEERALVAVNEIQKIVVALTLFAPPRPTRSSAKDSEKGGRQFG